MLRIPCPFLVPSFPLNLRLIYTTTLEGHLKYNMRKRELLGFPPEPVFPTNSLMLQITDVATQVKKPLCHFEAPLSLTPTLDTSAIYADSAFKICPRFDYFSQLFIITLDLVTFMCYLDCCNCLLIAFSSLDFVLSTFFLHSNQNDDPFKS